MEISRDKIDELNEIIEDSLEYFCDNQQLSGELAWTLVECLALTKIAEMNGVLASA